MGKKKNSKKKAKAISLNQTAGSKRGRAEEDAEKVDSVPLHDASPSSSSDKEYEAGSSGDEAFAGDSDDSEITDSEQSGELHDMDQPLTLDESDSEREDDERNVSVTATETSAGDAGDTTKSDKESVAFVLAPRSELYPDNVDFYETESEDELDETANTVGNVPLEWYRDYDHIGYDVKGRRVLKSEQGDRLDRFLASVDDPAYWRTVRDEMNARDVVLSEQQLELIRSMRGSRFPQGYNPYEENVEYPYEDSIHPVSNAPVPKRRFLPSKWEKEKIRKMMIAIRRGDLKVGEERWRKPERQLVDIWAAEGGANVRKPRLAPLLAPKVRLPGHAASYRPPEEYLFDEEELKEWQLMEPHERRLEFVPQRFERLRHVPGYARNLRERFDRCLDLYLCPRTRKVKKRAIDPKALIPKLPSPDDLRPFPTQQHLTYDGHTARVRSISVHCGGQWLCSGSDDGTARVWEVVSGKCMRVYSFGAVVHCVAWCPNADVTVFAVAVDDRLVFVDARLGSAAQRAASELALRYVPRADNEAALRKKSVEAAAAAEKLAAAAVWERVPERRLFNAGAMLQVRQKQTVKRIAWHRKGDYVASVAPNAASMSVLIHQLSRQRSQSPFSKAKGTVETVQFHPSKPQLFVATKVAVRIYDLMAQRLLKKLQPSVQHISSLSVHPGGDNVILGSYDKRLCWFDLDLSTRPYKTLRYHSLAVRQVQFHPVLPLFATCSDDCLVHVFHGTVYDDLAQNPLIVPLKILKGHEEADDLGVLDIQWHPTQCWLFSSGADSTIRLFTGTN